MILVKRSQISLFLILGIVLIVAVSFLIYIMNSGAKAIDQKSNDNSIKEVSGLVKGHVEQCMESTLKDGIEFIGKQGGVIYSDQIPGTKPIVAPSGYVTYNSRRIAVYTYQDQDLLKNRIIGVFCRKRGAVWPCIDLHTYPTYDRGSLSSLPNKKAPSPFNDQIDTKIPSYQLYMQLAPLCNYYGSNSPNAPDTANSCETYDSDSGVYENQSIQGYLNAFMQKNLPACLSNIATKPEMQGILVKPISRLDMAFYDDSIGIYLKVPIEAKNGIQVQNTEYMIRPKVRLKRFHEMLTHLLGTSQGYQSDKGDANDIFFDLRKDETKDCKDQGINGQPCRLPGMTISNVTENILGPLNLKYDILTAQDQGNGYWPLQFDFAMQERRPALQGPKIKNEVPDKIFGKYFNTPMVPDTLMLTVGPTTGDTYHLNFSGYDPNEIGSSQSCFYKGTVKDSARYAATLLLPKAPATPECSISGTGQCGEYTIQCSRTTTTDQIFNFSIQSANGQPYYDWQLLKVYAQCRNDYRDINGDGICEININTTNAKCGETLVNCGIGKHCSQRNCCILGKNWNGVACV